MESMQEQGLIRGLNRGGAEEGSDYIWDQLQQIQITPKGIDLLADKNMHSRVSDIIKGVVKLIPGL